VDGETDCHAALKCGKGGAHVRQAPHERIFQVYDGKGTPISTAPQSRPNSGSTQVRVSSVRSRNIRFRRRGI
jgi:hypothetical protein